MSLYNNLGCRNSFQVAGSRLRALHTCCSVSPAHLTIRCRHETGWNDGPRAGARRLRIHEQQPGCPAGQRRPLRADPGGVPGVRPQQPLRRRAGAPPELACAARPDQLLRSGSGPGRRLPQQRAGGWSRVPPPGKRAGRGLATLPGSAPGLGSVRPGAGWGRMETSRAAGPPSSSTPALAGSAAMHDGAGWGRDGSHARMVAPIRRGAPRRPVAQAGGLAGALVLPLAAAARSVSTSMNTRPGTEPEG
jgi:hypothetical protein